MIFLKFRQFIHRFFHNPKLLFCFFIGINLLPSICLLFTEPFSVTGKLVLLLFPAGLYLLFFSLSKNTGLVQLVLFPLLFLHAFQLVLFYLFGEAVIAVDMFLNLATTNASEAGELLDNIWPAVVLVCVLYIPTLIVAIIACKHKVYLPVSCRKKGVGTGVLLLFLSCLLLFTSNNNNTGRFTLYEDVYPVNVIYNCGFAIDKWRHCHHYPVLSKGFTFKAHKDTRSSKREIYVLVIGEASRAENWSLYGYSRETNPLLAQTSGLVVYKDAITQSNTTHKSVPLILSAASAEDYSVVYTHKSMLTAFKETGFTTIFLSNQTPNRSFTDFYFQEADHHQNIRYSPDGGMTTVNNFDEAMLPLLQHYVDSIPGNLFIILHTYGSHFNYKERYPGNFPLYEPDNVANVKVENKIALVNAYDNSVRYTDYFLYTLIEMLRKQEVISALFYTSDHGEDMLDDKRKRFLHSSPNPTFYQLYIPMFMWFSESYQRDFSEKVDYAVQNKAKPVATNAVFHTLLDVAFIQTPYLRSDLSLVSPHFQPRQRMYLNDHDKPIFFYNAGLKNVDKQMIDKRKLYH